MEMREVNVNYWIYPDGTTSIIVSGLFPWSATFDSPSEGILEVETMLLRIDVPIEVHWNLDGIGDGPTPTNDSDILH